MRAEAARSIVLYPSNDTRLELRLVIDRQRKRHAIDFVRSVSQRA